MQSVGWIECQDGDSHRGSSEHMQATRIDSCQKSHTDHPRQIDDKPLDCRNIKMNLLSDAILQP
eukprot:scaffold371317_cov13-Prasinocladus_malaysianus.AAC.1